MDLCIDEAQEHAQRRTLSPFLPTTATDLANIFEALQIGPRHVMLDLGCGDGRPLIAAGLLCGCHGVGVDISQECIDLARAIAAEERMNEDMVSFMQLDLLEDQDRALECLVAAVKAKAKEEGGEGEAETTVVIFLYVYPTLLARLVELVGRLARACQGDNGARERTVQVVTLTYHFQSPRSVAETAEWREVGEGRFQVHTLRGRRED